MKYETKESNLKSLNKILEKGKINDGLRKAVEAIIEAVKKDDVLLACELSSVKSLVSGSMNPKFDHYPYKEDNDYNKKHVGNSVYSILDGIHFAYSMKADRMPSGIMVISTEGTEHAKHTDNSNHPIVKQINAEFKRTWSRIK